VQVKRRCLRSSGGGGGHKFNSEGNVLATKVSWFLLHRALVVAGLVGLMSCLLLEILASNFAHWPTHILDILDMASDCEIVSSIM